jgi:hypothetical protein|tara:strand:+ start:107 stop:214 length:108 start_codon:yes stop_codon:yes gene_type:complete
VVELVDFPEHVDPVVQAAEEEKLLLNVDSVEILLL